jgi:adenylosuccinate lyase
MDLDPLTALSPIDGRYRKQTETLASYFSEFALIRKRVHVETEYLIFLSEKKFFPLAAPLKKKLRQQASDFSIEDALKVKALEKTTNHDVKAVEYFIKQELSALGGSAIKEWVHFGLTSQDINHTAVPCLWKEALEEVYLPALINLQADLQRMASRCEKAPMLARTHGQPASPTRMGKELMVFAERIENQLALFVHIPFTGKFGGATGNFNAHHAAFPKYDWKRFADQFLEKRLGLQRQQYTTQIEHYDLLAAHFDSIRRINTILLDFCRDIWTYISMEYFLQKSVKGETGSSAMPHKINPIDFENAEGNLGIANALLAHLSEKLPISRLQRDLSDSTVLRNIGVPLAHTLIALEAMRKGMGKLELNEKKMNADLLDNWAVVAEAVQTILRREGFPEPYEKLKELTRGQKHIDRNALHRFIDALNIKSGVKKELKSITPLNYTGI